ncbi:putative Mitogen-activated protein kinase 15 [Blattamonas nauphoetae]|uniref:Mitogen-activated protein kinase n=1 Tax=Blattamonas nauphoetae TaxID=2049346 RepID=A0ABQ9XLD3_9EUKA|nr:putative Mitogen-activated protein kinase 15 [Blattamonas nauphoetae]
MTEDIDAHILRKYDIIKKIGKGAYGIVWKVMDRRTHAVYALKKSFDAFQNPTDAQRTYREVMFLTELGRHENIVHLANVIKADNIKDIYLVFELLDTDLHVVIRSNILEPIHKQFVMYQCFKALKYMHSAGMLHRDLKPSNILLNSECIARVCDFGLARLINQKEGKGAQNALLTDYVATRWYRAPEILLGSHHYTPAVDMWSMGCILAEMLGGRPIFPGSGTSNQLARILEVTGVPDDDDIDSLKSQYAKAMVDSVRSSIGSRHKALNELFPNAPADALDLLVHLLQFNPNKRLTAVQALAHPYLSQFHSEEEEPECDHEIKLELDDDTKLSINDYRNALYRFIRQRHEQTRQARPHRSLPSVPGNTSQSTDQTRTASRQSSNRTSQSRVSTTSTSKDDKSSKEERRAGRDTRAESRIGAHRASSPSASQSRIGSGIPSPHSHSTVGSRQGVRPNSPSHSTTSSQAKSRLESMGSSGSGPRRKPQFTPTTSNPPARRPNSPLRASQHTNQ